MSCVCLHATGLLTPSQTTGSMVVEIRKNSPVTVWLTGSSAPCISIFKPFYFDSDVLDEANFISATSKFDNSYWWRWEEFHRKMLSHYKKWMPLFKEYQLKRENHYRDSDII